MQRIISDEEIGRLLREPKPLPDNWGSKLKPRAHVNQKSQSASIEVTGEDGRLFRLIVRQNPHSLLDFSIILGTVEAGELVHLVRCNGKHPSEHTNRWEFKRNLPTNPIRNQFHIHRATERYQLDGLAIEGFAEVTTGYGSVESALDFMIDNFGFIRPFKSGQETQRSLFSQ